MNESSVCGDRRERRPRPPIVKMTRALIGAAVAQRQPKLAFQLMTSGFQTVRGLSAAEQIDVAAGIVEEVTEEFRGLVGRRLRWAS